MSLLTGIRPPSMCWMNALSHHLSPAGAYVACALVGLEWLAQALEDVAAEPDPFV